MADLQLRKLLVEICSDLGTDDLDKLKFLLKDVTGSAKLELATMGIDLFSAIENNKHVNLRDGRYLAECFCLIGRNDLVRKLNFVPSDIEEKMTTESRLLPFRILLYRVTEDLGSKEFDQMKYYCSNTLKFKKREIERMKNAFDLFLLLEKRTFISPTSTSVLKEMLRSLDRGDLLDLIDEYQEKYPQMMDSESTPDSSQSNGRTLPLNSEPPSADMNTSPDSCPVQTPLQNPKQVDTNGYNTGPVAVYDMTAYPRGYCIIINNNKFHKPNRSRMGSDVDAKHLHETFHKLGFLVKEYKDLKVKEMSEVMMDLSKLDHSKFNALVVCILSHGGENTVYGVDDEEIPVRYLTMNFRSSRCKTLANKPKLFFIQACQGEERQKGLHPRDLSIQADGPSEEPASAPDVDATTAPVDNKKIIPDESDFLVGYATVTGYVSFRSRSRGSFYIQKLTDNLNKYASSLDLMTILTRVNHDVSSEEIPGGHIQVPMPWFSLRKNLYFFPDNLPPARTIAYPSDAPLGAEGVS